MILIIHESAQKVFQILRNEDEIAVHSNDLNSELIRLARKYPKELILWVEKKYQVHFNISSLGKIFHHDLMMCSFAVENQYLPETIGYIDQWPFVNPDYKVSYPTWRMSTDMGGIKGRTLLSFESVFRKNYDFGYNLNSIAKLGQQNGLFCYSEPRLLQDLQQAGKLNYLSGSKELFRFVRQHYKWPWVFILSFCFYKYESTLPFWDLIRSFISSKHFRKNFELDTDNINSEKFKEKTGDTIDVVIPTLGRPEHLRQVLADLSAQTHLPKRVIVVEQNPDPFSKTDLPEIRKMQWPFEMKHIFTHVMGACNARNIGLDHVTSEWTFLSDDDQRIEPGFLSSVLKEIKKLGAPGVTTSYLQPDENKKLSKVKQWGTFGAGNSIISSKFASLVRFDTSMEFGYGEDKDFGMQLRKVGCDIIYHPGLEISHLKAPVGGFRNKEKKPWEERALLPKPSPTLMAYAKKYFSEEQLSGFKVELFLRYYPKQEIKNPWTYIKTMRRRWKESEKWAQLLEEKKSRPVKV
ncbi:glycosyltransferase family 2 protein [Salinimicrobium sp. HB62]|uniref:glycosyltransferase family 2 protein n=1 Tax=Salinimicrobium sp. HB62 TaxID=3077781 RepID=UPI002D7742BE|nr:glycosyltransferase [Salinimicrobium sp. HB62]